jgi:hypothetical protein
MKYVTALIVFLDIAISLGGVMAAVSSFSLIACKVD